MCVHVYCAERMPDETLVWARRSPDHIVVYADSSLATRDGTLTAAGAAKVNEALAVLPGAPSLETAKPCS
jgi:hypothetical protein